MIEHLNRCNISTLNDCSYNDVLHSCYDYNELSLQELLCQYFKKINDCIDDVNKYSELVKNLLTWIETEGLGKEVLKILEKWKNDGVFTEIIEGVIFKDFKARLEKIETKTNYFTTPENYGAKGDGINNDTEALKNAFKDSKTKVIFLSGNYIYNDRSPIVIDRPIKIIFGEGGQIQVKQITTLFKVSATHEVSIENGKITGTGAMGNSVHLLHIADSSNVIIKNIEVTQANETAINFVNCTDCIVENTHCHHNYLNGIVDKKGVKNTFRNNTCNYNGVSTGGSTVSTKGRGILLWMCKDCNVLENEVKFNTEYGIRLYSHSSDDTSMINCIVDKNVLEDNGSLQNDSGCIDIYFYNESKRIKDCKITNNNIKRTRKFGSSSNTCISVGGENTVCEGNTVLGVNSQPLEFQGIGIYDAINPIVRNNRVENFTVGISTSSNAPNSLIEGNLIKCKSGIGQIDGINHRIINNRFISVGEKAECIKIVTMNGTQIINNHFDGFKRAIQIDDSSCVITGNTTINSTEKGLYKYGDKLENILINSNNFESAHPDLLGRMIMPQNGIHIIYNNQSPQDENNLTWSKGDICMNSSVNASGNPRGWICTTPGKPGTWTSLGNLG